MSTPVSEPNNNGFVEEENKEEFLPEYSFYRVV